jgi:hypothetical protein
MDKVQEPRNPDCYHRQNASEFSTAKADKKTHNEACCTQYSSDNGRATSSQEPVSGRVLLISKMDE